MNCGFGGITSGFGRGGETSASEALRFLDACFDLPMTFELGSWGGSGMGGALIGEAGVSWTGGGDTEGMDEGGENEVMSTDGERGRLKEDA